MSHRNPSYKCETISSNSASKEKEMRQMFCSVHVVFTQWENLKWLPQATTVVMLRWLEADHRRWAWKVWWSLNVVKGRRWRSFTSQNGLVKAQFCFYCHIKLRSLGKVTLGLCYRILEYQSIVLSGWIKTEQKSKNEMLWIHIKVIRKMQLDATERTELFFYCARGELGPGAVLTALPTNILHN